LVTSVRQVTPGQELSVRVRDGVFAAMGGARLAWEPDAIERPAQRATVLGTPGGGRLVAADVLADDERISGDGN
jgi:hypothetical protein